MYLFIRKCAHMNMQYLIMCAYSWSSISHDMRICMHIYDNYQCVCVHMYMDTHIDAWTSILWAQTFYALTTKAHKPVHIQAHITHSLIQTHTSLAWPIWHATRVKPWNSRSKRANLRLLGGKMLLVLKSMCAQRNGPGTSFWQFSVNLLLVLESLFQALTRVQNDEIKPNIYWFECFCLRITGYWQLDHL